MSWEAWGDPPDETDMNTDEGLCPCCAAPVHPDETCPVCPPPLDYERRILAAECGTQRVLVASEFSLRRACRLMVDDHQTSDTHHPNHILVCKDAFEQMREGLESQPPLDPELHKAWRQALIMARDEMSEDSEDPPLERAYWNQKLAAFDRFFGRGVA